MSKCDICGRFYAAKPGAAWKMIYSGWPPEPDREITRCLRCVKRYGPFDPDPRIRPECSCGIFKENKP
jgi:hypothetical protein